MLINVKMQLTFMSRINFVLSLVEYEKSCITPGPGQNVGSDLDPNRLTSEKIF